MSEQMAATGQYDGQVPGQGMNRAMRDKNWDELTDAEKIERLREQVKRLARIVDAHDRGIYTMQEHSHSLTGEILVPMNSRRGMGESSSRRNDEYF